MKCGVIGLGNMGSGIAQTLARSGHELLVYNRTKSRAEALSGKEICIAKTLAEACEADAVVTMLADDSAVEEVLPQILENMKPGSVHISCSTISPSLSLRLEKEHEKHGNGYVSAPVFGRPDMARAGSLVVVAAGKSTHLSRIRPLLEAMGRKLFVVGENPQTANLIKLSGNLLIASFLEGLAEIYALLKKSNIDLKLFLEIVNGSLFQSPVIQNYGERMAEARFNPAGFKMKLGLKDVELALNAARQLNVPLPLGSLLRDHFLSGLARGKEELDWSALALVLAENAGVLLQ